MGKGHVTVWVIDPFAREVRQQKVSVGGLDDCYTAIGLGCSSVDLAFSSDLDTGDNMLVDSMVYDRDIKHGFAICGQQYFGRGIVASLDGNGDITSPKTDRMKLADLLQWIVMS